MNKNHSKYMLFNIFNIRQQNIKSKYQVHEYSTF